jgi:hypothetical protein
MAARFIERDYFAVDYRFVRQARECVHDRRILAVEAFVVP